MKTLKDIEELAIEGFDDRLYDFAVLYQGKFEIMLQEHIRHYKNEEHEHFYVPASNGKFCFNCSIRDSKIEALEKLKG